MRERDALTLHAVVEDATYDLSSEKIARILKGRKKIIVDREHTAQLYC